MLKCAWMAPAAFGAAALVAVALIGVALLHALQPAPAALPRPHRAQPTPHVSSARPADPCPQALREVQRHLTVTPHLYACALQQYRRLPARVRTAVPWQQLWARVQRDPRAIAYGKSLLDQAQRALQARGRDRLAQVQRLWQRLQRNPPPLRSIGCNALQRLPVPPPGFLKGACSQRRQPAHH